jgi:hypothetical protein
MVLILLASCEEPPRTTSSMVWSVQASGVEFAEATVSGLILREPAGATFLPEDDGRGAVVGAWQGAVDVNLLAAPDVGEVRWYPGLVATVTLALTGDQPVQLGDAGQVISASSQIEVTVPAVEGDATVVTLDARGLWSALEAELGPPPWSDEPDLTPWVADPAWWRAEVAVP